MRQVKKNAYVNFSAEQMFVLVDDIKSYPEFLPWCTRTIIHDRAENSVSATIEFKKGGINLKFKFKNPLLNATMGSIFESICDDQVNAFVLRAQEIYEQSA